MPLRPDRFAEFFARAACEVLVCLRFYSRLAVPDLPFERVSPGFAVAIRMVPLAALLIGAAGALTLAAAAALGLPPDLAAVAALAVEYRVTGGLHEDGLADTADGLGGGRDRDRKLVIMRDSRIGSYGAAALILSFLARMAALAGLVAHVGAGFAGLGLLAACVASRVAGLLPLWLLPPARQDGMSRSAGAPRGGPLMAAFGLGAVITLALAGPAVGWRASLLACIATILAALYIVHLARRHLGGHTGDICGASQQLAEIAFLSALLIRFAAG